MKRRLKEIFLNKHAYFFIIPSLVVMTVIVFYPLIKTIGYSFTNIKPETISYNEEAIQDEIAGKNKLKSAMTGFSSAIENYKKAVDSGISIAAAEQELLQKYSQAKKSSLFSLKFRSIREKMESDTGWNIQMEDVLSIKNKNGNTPNTAELSSLLSQIQLQCTSILADVSNNISILQQKEGVKSVGLDNYKKIFTRSDTNFWKVLWQSILWTVVNVSLHFFIGLWLANLIYKSYSGSVLYRTLIISPWAVPTFVAAFAWRFLYEYNPDPTKTGFINQIVQSLGLSQIQFLTDDAWVMIACIIVNVWVGVPFMMITILGGMQSISKDHYEAAYLDGASKTQQFWYITMPSIRPVASVAILLGAIWTFNMFNIIYLVTIGSRSDARHILVTYAYEAFSTDGGSNYALAATYGVVILSFLLAFGSFYIRKLKKEGSF